ncbi:hypothetical protein TNCV_695651 [Trichonephila clavipes]|nr:hypothetical protein TNCV_695651 [Trichonephila clavipes]
MSDIRFRLPVSKSTSDQDSTPCHVKPCQEVFKIRVMFDVTENHGMIGTPPCLPVGRWQSRSYACAGFLQTYKRPVEAKEAWRVVGSLEGDQTQAEVAQAIGVSESVISRIWNRFWRLEVQAEDQGKVVDGQQRQMKIVI